MAVTIEELTSGRTGSTTYKVRWRDVAGASRSKSFKRLPDAELYKAQLTTQLASGEYIDPARGRERFGDFYARWIKGRTQKPSRTAAEATWYRCHIKPRWESVPLNKITLSDVEHWLKNLTAVRPGSDGLPRPAGDATKLEVLAHFKQALQAAVDNDLIRRNPAAKAKGPTKARKKVTSTDVLEAHELDRLVAAVPDRYKALVYLSGWLGWRWSEAMGLRNCDVDLAAGVVHLGNEVVIESEGRFYARAGGKTDAASRSVPLPDAALAALRAHMDAGFSNPGPIGRVFVTEEGNTPFRSNFRRVFLKAVADAGLSGRGVNMRQLRHTAATLMLSAGLDVLDVQERLGHARGSVTLDIYGRVLSSRRAVGTARMSEVMADSDTDWTQTIRRDHDDDSAA